MQCNARVVEERTAEKKDPAMVKKEKRMYNRTARAALAPSFFCTRYFMVYPTTKKKSNKKNSFFCAGCPPPICQHMQHKFTETKKKNPSVP
jgi:hypothetical protein